MNLYRTVGASIAVVTILGVGVGCKSSSLSGVYVYQSGTKSWDKIEFKSNGVADLYAMGNTTPYSSNAFERNGDVITVKKVGIVDNIYEIVDDKTIKSNRAVYTKVQ
jgi:hypothetical protein